MFAARTCWPISAGRDAWPEAMTPAVSPPIPRRPARAMACRVARRTSIDAYRTSSPRVGRADRRTANTWWRRSQDRRHFPFERRLRRLLFLVRVPIDQIQQIVGQGLGRDLVVHRVKLLVQ